jgi:hypothetical protein
LLREIQQFVGSIDERERRRRRGRFERGGAIASQERSSAMLTNDLLAEMFDPNVQASPAGRTFLHEVRAFRHFGISFYR